MPRRQPKPWPEAEAKLAGEGKACRSADGLITLPGRQLTAKQLRALLNTLPLEIIFVDADDTNRFFNEGPKVFKRPLMSLGRKVFACHPPKVKPMVKSIIEDFRLGKKDCVPVWMEKGGHAMLVNYTAVRDSKGHYLGTLEAMLDMDATRANFEKPGRQHPC